MSVEAGKNYVCIKQNVLQGMIMGFHIKGEKIDTSVTRLFDSAVLKTYCFPTECSEIRTAGSSAGFLLSPPKQGFPTRALLTSRPRLLLVVGPAAY